MYLYSLYLDECDRREKDETVQGEIKISLRNVRIVSGKDIIVFKNNTPCLDDSSHCENEWSV